MISNIINVYAYIVIWLRMVTRRVDVYLCSLEQWFLTDVSRISVNS